MSCVGNPGTRALTVAEADAEADALTVGDAVLVAVGLLEGAAEEPADAGEVPEVEQAESRRAAAATTGTRLPRRFHNSTATRILRRSLFRLFRPFSDPVRAEPPVKSNCRRR
jgi:hypothetical protein